MRLDLLLKSLCLVKTRSLARKGCESGSIKVNGAEARPSREIREGDMLEIRYPDRIMVVELTAIPGGQVPKNARGEYFRVVRESPLNRDSGGWNA